MKNLIVYYSLEGHTKEVAETLKSMVEADICEIVPARPIKSKGKFGQIFRAMMMFLFNKKPKILNNKLNLDDYDKILVGTPVWMGTIVPYLRSFFAMNPIEGKKIYPFVCYGGNEGRAVAGLEKLLAGNTICESLGIDDNDTDKKAKIQQFAKMINDA